MSATWDWEEDNGVATGSPTKGTTRTTGRAEQNWKNIDDSTTAYTTNPITAGGNSFEKNTFGKFSGAYNSISTVLWAHTAGTFGTGCTIKGVVGTAYTTPTTAANTNLTVDMTTPIAIGSGQAVLVGATGPEAAGKTSSTAVNPAYTQFLTHQLQTTTSTAPGDTTNGTFAVQYNEN